MLLAKGISARLARRLQVNPPAITEKTQMIRHRSILYIAGGMRVRHALGVAPAAENYRVVSAAHRQNALLEFGTDQIDGDRMRIISIGRYRHHTPKGTGPTTSRTTTASLALATP